MHDRDSGFEPLRAFRGVGMERHLQLQRRQPRFGEAVPAGTITPRSGLSAGGGRCTLQGGGGGSLFGGDDYKCAFDGVQSEAT